MRASLSLLKFRIALYELCPFLSLWVFIKWDQNFHFRSNSWCQDMDIAISFIHVVVHVVVMKKLPNPASCPCELSAFFASFSRAPIVRDPLWTHSYSSTECKFPCKFERMKASDELEVGIRSNASIFPRLLKRVIISWIPEIIASWFRIFFSSEDTLKKKNTIAR